MIRVNSRLLWCCFVVQVEDVCAHYQGPEPPIHLGEGGTRHGSFPYLPPDGSSVHLPQVGQHQQQQQEQQEQQEQEWQQQQQQQEEWQRHRSQQFDRPQQYQQQVVGEGAGSGGRAGPGCGAGNGSSNSSSRYWCCAEDDGEQQCSPVSAAAGAGLWAPPGPLPQTGAPAAAEGAGAGVGAGWGHARDSAAAPAAGCEWECSEELPSPPRTPSALAAAQALLASSFSSALGVAFGSREPSVEPAVEYQQQQQQGRGQGRQQRESDGRSLGGEEQQQQLKWQQWQLQQQEQRRSAERSEPRQQQQQNVHKSKRHREDDMLPYSSSSPCQGLDSSFLGQEVEDNWGQQGISSGGDRAVAGGAVRGAGGSMAVQEQQEQQSGVRLGEQQQPFVAVGGAAVARCLSSKLEAASLVGCAISEAVGEGGPQQQQPVLMRQTTADTVYCSLPSSPQHQQQGAEGLPRGSADQGQREQQQEDWGSSGNAASSHLSAAPATDAGGGAGHGHVSKQQQQLEQGVSLLPCGLPQLRVDRRSSAAVYWSAPNSPISPCRSCGGGHSSSRSRRSSDEGSMLEPPWHVSEPQNGDGMHGRGAVGGPVGEGGRKKMRVGPSRLRAGGLGPAGGYGTGARLREVELRGGVGAKGCRSAPVSPRGGDSGHPGVFVDTNMGDSFVSAERGCGVGGGHSSSWPTQQGTMHSVGGFVPVTTTSDHCTVTRKQGLGEVLRGVCGTRACSSSLAWDTSSEGAYMVKTGSRPAHGVRIQQQQQQHEHEEEQGQHLHNRDNIYLRGSSTVCCPTCAQPLERHLGNFQGDGICYTGAPAGGAWVGGDSSFTGSMQGQWGMGGSTGNSSSSQARWEAPYSYPATASGDGRGFMYSPSEGYLTSGGSGSSKGPQTLEQLRQQHLAAQQRQLLLKASAAAAAQAASGVSSSSGPSAAAAVVAGLHWGWAQWSEAGKGGQQPQQQQQQRGRQQPSTPPASPKVGLLAGLKGFGIPLLNPLGERQGPLAGAGMGSNTGGAGGQHPGCGEEVPAIGAAGGQGQGVFSADNGGGDGDGSSSRVSSPGSEGVYPGVMEAILGAVGAGVMLDGVKGKEEAAKGAGFSSKQEEVLVAGTPMSAAGAQNVSGRQGVSAGITFTPAAAAGGTTGGKLIGVAQVSGVVLSAASSVKTDQSYCGLGSSSKRGQSGPAAEKTSPAEQGVWVKSSGQGGVAAAAGAESAGVAAAGVGVEEGCRCDDDAGASMRDDEEQEGGDNPPSKAAAGAAPGVACRGDSSGATGDSGCCFEGLDGGPAAEETDEATAGATAAAAAAAGVGEDCGGPRLGVELGSSSTYSCRTLVVQFSDPALPRQLSKFVKVRAGGREAGRSVLEGGVVHIAAGVGV